MITLTPVELLLRVSAASVGAIEYPPNSNAGPYVQRVLKRTGLGKGYAWCSAQVTDWGVLALGDAWPVKRSASVQTIVDWARQARCWYPAGSVGAGVPQPGDLYAVWYPGKKRYAHIGIVVRLDKPMQVWVRDGNTSEPGDTNPETQREGWGVFEKSRTLTHQDGLIRRTEALKLPLGADQPTI